MDYGAGAGSAFVIAFGLALAGLLGCIPLFMVFRWWSEGKIGGVDALGLVAMFIIMFACLLGPAPIPIKAIIAVLFFGATLGFSILPTISDKRSAASFETEKETVYRTAIETNPRNIPARIELARNLHAQKRLSEAIETLEMAIQLSPATTLAEQSLLKTWLREQENRPKSTMICRWCREETTLDRGRCVHCDRPLSTIGEMSEAITGDIPGMVRSFLILLPILLGIGLFFSLFGNTLFGMLLMGVLVVAGLWWVRSRF